MRLVHPSHPGRAAILAYCLNLHPAEDLPGLLAGLRAITLPLRDRLRCTSGFGVGMYLPAALAAELSCAGRPAQELAAFLRGERLDPFTYNAFPYGDFQRPGLKERVFEPTWEDPGRLRFTLDVARAAVRLGAPGEDGDHVSISTHAGMHASRLQREEQRGICARTFAQAAAGLAALERESGVRVVLALEAEPRSLCNDTADLARWLAELRSGEGPPAHERARHLGACLDTCHAAVEFEPAAQALSQATAGGAPLGKIQFTSALALADPAANERGRERLLALDEPRFLHQVSGAGPGILVRAGDLSDVARAWKGAGSPWRSCREWRCHFHVPVDLGELASEGLGTTRAFAGEVLALALADPARWGTRDLHVEIETYTWDILPRAARGTGELVDGLEREYAHVLALFDTHGWRRA